MTKILGDNPFAKTGETGEAEGEKKAGRKAAPAASARPATPAKKAAEAEPAKKAAAKAGPAKKAAEPAKKAAAKAPAPAKKAAAKAPAPAKKAAKAEPEPAKKAAAQAPAPAKKAAKAEPEPVNKAEAQAPAPAKKAAEAARPERKAAAEPVTPAEPVKKTASIPVNETPTAEKGPAAGPGEPPRPPEAAGAPGGAPASQSVLVETIEVVTSAADGVTTVVDAVLVSAAPEAPGAPPQAAPADEASPRPAPEAPAPAAAAPTAAAAAARAAHGAGEDAALVLVPPAPATAPRERRHKALSALGRRYRDLALRGRATTVDDFGLDVQALERYAPALDWLYSRYFRVETEGLENVPDHGRALLVANRAGTLPWDSLMLSHAVRREHPMRRPVRPLLEDDAFHAPYLGALLQRLGAVRACQENAERLLQAEQLALAFPEGQKGSGKHFSERYHLQRFGRGGFIKLALRTRTPILPVAIVGAEEAQPLLGKLGWLGRPLGLSHLPLTPTFPWLGPIGLLPLPSKWHLAIGEPIHLYAEYDPSAADDLGLALRLAEQVRSRIQEMLGGLLGRRRSPWALREALRGTLRGNR